MNMKKTLPAFALLLALTSFTACASGTDAEFGNYWNGEKLNAVKEIDETLVYDVVFDATESIVESLDYTFAYSNGVLTTKLTDTTTHDGKVAYIFKSEMSIDVTYTWNGETTAEPLKDSIVSEVMFYEAANNLKPIYSTKTIVAHSPSSSSSHSALSECYSTSTYSVTTDYATNTSTVTKPDTDLTYNDSFEMDEKYAFIDNEQLLVAIRAFDNSTTSATVESYSPFVGTPQKIKFTFASETQGTIFKHSENGIKYDSGRPINYRSVTMEINEKNSGAAQTAWIATDAKDFRHVLLRLETPAAYSLGTFIYTLKSVERK